MARYNKAINSFSSGEMGPKTRSRFDINEYAQGLETMENFIPYRSGGAVRRPGSKHKATISTTLIGTDDSFYGGIPFIFSQSEAYTVVINPDNNIPNDAIKIYKRNGVQVTATYTAPNFFDLPNFSSSLDPNGFHFAQSGDVLYIVHNSGNYPPFLIKRTSQDTFEINHIWDNYDRPYKAALLNTYLTPNTDAGKCLYFDSTTGFTAYERIDAQYASVPSKTVYSVNSSGTAIDTVFDPSHVGSIWRVTDKTALKECVIVITAVAGNKQSATCSVLVSYDTTLVGVGNRSDDWAEGAWSDYRGWPRTVSFFEQRLIFGGNQEKPDTLWCSKVGDYNKFQSDRLDQDVSSDGSKLGFFGDITNGDPFNATIASTEVNDIRWVQTSDVLVCGTSGVEYVIRPVDGIFGRNNINIRPISNYGSAPVQAVKGGGGIFYVSRDGKRVRRFSYSDSNGEYSDLDITTLNSDIIYFNTETLAASTEFKSVTVKQMAWQESRATMWFITSNKKLIGFTIDPKSGVSGWHRHSFSPGTGSSEKSDVVGIISIPNESNTYEDLWIVIRRQLFTQDIVSLEKMGDDFEHPTLYNTSTAEDDHPTYVDSSLRFTAALASATKDFVDGDVSTAQDYVYWAEPHNYHQAQEVTLTTTGTLPTGLATGTSYWLIVQDRHTIRFAASESDANTGKSAAVIITAASGGGTHTINPVAVTSLPKVSGLNHLAGQEIGIMNDGVFETAVVGINQSVTTGIGPLLELASPPDEFIGGLEYTGTLKTMPLEAGQQFGASRGNISRIDRANLMFYKTFAAQVGSDENDMYDVEMDVESNTLDEVVDFPASPDRSPQVIIKTKNGYPCSVLGMTLRGVSNDG